jgi:hypothetical protein
MSLLLIVGKKHEVGMTSNDIKFIPNSVKISQAVQKVKGDREGAWIPHKPTSSPHLRKESWLKRRPNICATQVRYTGV